MLKLKKNILFITLLLSMMTLTGCSVQKLAAGVTGGIIDNTMESIFEEQDLPLAKAAIEANLKMLEGLIKTDPGNRRMLLNTVMGYTGYALGFVEDDDPVRAAYFYKKAKDYGVTLMSQKSYLKDALESPPREFKEKIAKMTIKDVPAVFWTANAWASYINLSRQDISVMMDLPRVMDMMNRVIELDEEFYYGGAHLFFGTMYASLGIAGGNIPKSKEHFDRAREITSGNFLLTDVFFARYYAVAEWDEELFDSLLAKVLKAPADMLPEVRLINEIAKSKARKYITMRGEWF